MVPLIKGDHQVYEWVHISVIKGKKNKQQEERKGYDRVYEWVHIKCK